MTTNTKPVLFVDVDDTILADCGHQQFEMRPGALPILFNLTNFFECRWLTCWPEDRISQLLKLLYAHKLHVAFTYQKWDKDNKALTAIKEKDFYWLEDNLCKDELAVLEKKNLLHRYYRVNSKGKHEFTYAVNKLLDDIGYQNLIAIGGEEAADKLFKTMRKCSE